MVAEKWRLSQGGFIYSSSNNHKNTTSFILVSASCLVSERTNWVMKDNDSLCFSLMFEIVHLLKGKINVQFIFLTSLRE